MDLAPYVDDLRSRLAVAAEVGGPDAQDLARRLSAPLDAAVRLVLLDALATAAAEISAELAPGSVDVRLRDGSPEFVVDAAPVTATAPSAVPPVTTTADTDEGTTTRTTLRLPDHLKTRVEAAAARDGVSVNTWLVRAVTGALEHPRTTSTARAAQQSTSRFTGWAG